MEGTLSYTGDVSDPNKGKCNLKYYIKLTRDLTNMEVHYISVNEMAGLLTDCSVTILVSALR